MSFEKLTDIETIDSQPYIKPDPDAPALPFMSSSAPALSPWSAFYMSQGFQSFPFPSPSTGYAMAMSMGVNASDLVMPTPGPWGDYSQYPPLGVSPGPQPYPGGAFPLDASALQAQALLQQQGFDMAPPPDSSSSAETSSSRVSATLYQTPSRPLSSGPPSNATSYFQCIPPSMQKPNLLPQQLQQQQQQQQHQQQHQQQQQHARAPEPPAAALRNVAHTNSSANMNLSRSPSPSRSISPALLTKDLHRRGSTTHQQTQMNVPYPRDSIDSTTSMISVDGGIRSAAASIHSSDGLDEDDAMYAEGDDALNEHDLEGEGTERNGMMWGMKTDEYKSLSARERKRVRNRISARTFRARRKEHLSSLESTLSNKDHMIRRLQEENIELRGRLSKYEKPLARNGPAKGR